MSHLFVRSGAVISPCGKYRYRLWRTWDHNLPPLPWIMLNPSTADADKDDPTIRKCIKFSCREGAGGIEVLNLFALRATNPRELLKSDDPIGPDNDRYIGITLAPYPRVVAAWGKHGSYHKREIEVMLMLVEMGLQIVCLGDTPTHPLYVRDSQPFVDCGQ